MPSFERSVFLNYPFDKSIEPLLHAIVLTIVARGFIPRSAREGEGQAELRMAVGLYYERRSVTQPSGPKIWSVIVSRLGWSNSRLS